MKTRSILFRSILGVFALAALPSGQAAERVTLSERSCQELAELADGAYNDPAMQRKFRANRQVLRYAALTARTAKGCKPSDTPKIAKK
jgi:hypothetical protein